MDSRLEAGEERRFLFPASSSPAVPDGYFATQALRSTFPYTETGLRDDMRRGELVVHETVSAWEIPHSEMLKQRIREEIIAREVAERRMLEEEVRRDLQMERAAMVMRRFQENRFSPAGSVAAQEDMFSPAGPVAALEEPRVWFGRFGSEVGDERRMVGTGVTADGLFGENVFSERMGGGRLLRTAAKGRLFLPHNDHKDKGSAFTSGPSAKPPKVTVAGIKRKAGKLPGIDQKRVGEPPHSTKRGWRCELCQVSATSRKSLNHHLQGKKHKAREALPGVAKVAVGAGATVAADKKPLTSAKGVGLRKGQKNPVGRNLSRKGAAPPPVKKRKTNDGLWCDLCKLECNSDSMLASHLGGKKHRAKLESSQRSKGAAAPTVAETKTAGAPPDNQVGHEFDAETKLDVRQNRH